MSKAKKIVYWIATGWLALGMASTGFVQLFKVKEEAAYLKGLHYPAYFFALLGVWKMLGAVAILLPRFPLLKEWAYAGFFFVMTGAAYSHIASGTTSEIFPSLLLLALTIISWYFRLLIERLCLWQPPKSIHYELKSRFFLR